MERIITLAHFKKFLILLGFLFLLGIYLPKIVSDSGEKNLYVHQASAFMHGHLNIDQNLQDVAVYKSKYYTVSTFPCRTVVTCCSSLWGVFYKSYARKFNP